jgi:hypothetical protein
LSQWQQYLFRNHNEVQLGDWARRLKHFRFCRAIGGHANDGDQLLLALRHAGTTDLDKLGSELGVAKLTSGMHILAGIPVCIMLTSDKVLVSIVGSAGDPYEVTSKDVDNAELLESRLSIRAGRILEPPIDDEHCISPKYYPHFWRDQ